jgi:hypothetical protein
VATPPATRRASGPGALAGLGEAKCILLAMMQLLP